MTILSFLSFFIDLQVLREDVDDLLESSNHNDETMYWHVKTETGNLQRQIDTLVGKVETLQGQVEELSGWRVGSETTLSNLEQRVGDNYSELYSYLSEVSNKARDLEFLIEDHHSSTEETQATDAPVSTETTDTGSVVEVAPVQ